MIVEKKGVRIPLKKSGEDGTNVEKANAFALVSGFSPLRGNKKIWRPQRLEHRSVRAASIQVFTLILLKKTKGCGVHFV
ncbi:hypothetical protein ACFSQ7_41490 [Paenibacillus rhizoplanae]